jgi:twitching motility protein PilT
MTRITPYLLQGRERGGSDVHVSAGLPPMMRLDGELIALDPRRLSEGEVDLLVAEVLPPELRERLEKLGAADFSHQEPEAGRFRMNVCRQRLGFTLVARLIPDRIPKLDDLGLPPIVAQLAALHSGLVLVTGGAGTGKSTTLAALVDRLNQTRNLTIVSLEEPIEFVHASRMSLVVQREVGRDVRTYHDGLRAALRQDPDVIVVGEMRDRETISLAIEAAETGHLVFGTLNTRSAHQTVHRVLDVFPTESQNQVRHTLAENLRGVVTQDLIKVADGRGRRLVCEVLVVNAAVAQLIREGKTFQIPGAIATGRRLGMQLMDQALVGLVRAGKIDPDDAFLRAGDKRELVPFVTQPALLALAGGSAAEIVEPEETR